MTDALGFFFSESTCFYRVMYDCIKGRLQGATILSVTPRAVSPVKCNQNGDCEVLHHLALFATVFLIVPLFVHNDSRLTFTFIDF